MQHQVGVHLEEGLGPEFPRNNNDKSGYDRTAGEAKTISLTADRTSLKADGQSLAFITIELQDANGTLNPTASNELEATVKGPATIVAFGNADIKDTGRYTDHTHNAWKGRALLVVKSTRKPGTVTVTVRSKGLEQGTVRL